MAKAKKDRKKSTFTEILNLRLAKTVKVLGGIKRQFVRSSLGGDEFGTIETAIASLTAKAATLAADFKPARVAATVQPMSQGTEIEISDAKRADLGGLMGATEVAGKWIVNNADDARVFAHSVVNPALTSVFARRDVHLAGIERVKRQPKLGPDGQPVPRKKRTAKVKVAEATL